jgi:hypothetical protein
MLAANAVESATAALMGDVAHLRNDVATSALRLVNAAQSSPTNTSPLASVTNLWNRVENVLATDFNQTWQAAAQFDYAILGAYLQAFETQLADMGIYQPGQATSPSPTATGSGTGSGSMGSGHSDGSQSSSGLLSSRGSGSGSGSSGLGGGVHNSPFLQSGSGSGSTAINVTDPGNQTSAEGDTVSLQIYASGGNGGLIYGFNNLPAGLTIDSTTGLISGTLDYTDAETESGQYSVTINVYDSNGDAASTTFNWSVADTDTAPTIRSDLNPGNQTNFVGDAVALQLATVDPDGDSLTYSATGLPGGLALNPTTGLLAGVISSSDVSSSPYNVTVTIADASNAPSFSFTWTVTTVKIDPVADQSNLIGDNVSVPVNAFSMSGGPMSYTAAGLPPGLSINSTTGLISGTIANTASITTPYNVTVTATDGTGSASTSLTWSISSFMLDNPGDQTNAEGEPVALPLTVETNSNPTLTFSATGLPDGLGINPTTGLIAGTIASLDAENSPYSVTVSASDGTTTASQTFSWTVTHVLLTNPGDQINTAGEKVALHIQASDPDGDALSYSATGLPAGLSIDAATGLISGIISNYAGSGTPYSVTVTASDGAEPASVSFNWWVARQAGSLEVVDVTNPGTQNNAEGDNVSLQMSATDAYGYGLTYSAAGLPPGLQIDPASGLIAGAPDIGDANVNSGVYQATVLAQDSQGNNGSAAFTWNISHTDTPPTLDNPGYQVNSPGDVVSLSLSGYDEDGDTVT